MNGIIKRSISGIVYIAIIIAGILCGTSAYSSLLLLLGITAAIEFSRLLAGQKASTALTTALDVAGTIFMISGFIAANLIGSPSIAWCFATLYILYLVARLVCQLYLPALDAIRSLGYSFFSQIYIALPISLMTLLYSRCGTPHLVLGIFIMIWLNDTGAFIVGSAIGRHRLFPRISPKKSWEGFWGGVVFAIAAGILFGTCFQHFFSGLDTIQLAVAGAVVAAFATWGDLVESLIKRTLGVKDSGNIIPGHGGILDRIDSLLLVAPAMVAYIVIIEYIIPVITNLIF